MMRRFPVTCYDGFYKDPDKIRKYALSQEYNKCPNGAWPGRRTKYLNILNPKLFGLFVNKVSYLFYDLSNKLEMTIQTCFYIVEPFEDDTHSKKNRGWVHKDSDNEGEREYDFAGIVYLTPDIELDSGTIIYQQKTKNFVDYSDNRAPFYKDGIDVEFEKHYTKHNSQFEETVRFANIYNRMILYEQTDIYNIYICTDINLIVYLIYYIYIITLYLTLRK
jgi:hypothetical protein